jgi:hypothetical protein
MASCSQDILPVDEVNESETFTGQLMDAFSRTSIDANNDVIWQSDDEISIFTKTGYHQQWKVKEGAGTTSATFGFVSSLVKTSAFDSHYAIYPFNANYQISENKQVTVDLSSWANQVYQEGTFESGKSVMTAKSTTMNLPFLNASSLVRVELSSVVPGSYSISSISLSSSQALNGSGVIDLSVDKPIVTLTGTADVNKCITLQCAQPVLLEDMPVDFYILVPAKTYSDLTLAIKGTNEMDGTPFSWSAKLTNVTCNRSKIRPIQKTFDPVEFSGSLEGTN